MGTLLHRILSRDNSRSNDSVGQMYNFLVRDDFLRLWPEYPARTRKATIKDFGLVHWRDFGKLHIGLASYAEPVRRTPDEYFEWMPRHQEHIEQVERERSWWRTVRELQKFIEP